MLERFSIYIKVFLGLAATVGIILSFNAYFAKASELAAMDQKLEYKIARDDMRDYQDQMWRIEDRYGKDPARMPPEIRNQYRRLHMLLEDARKRVDYFRGKK